ncbi:unnamed protein product [Clonostachys rhizophaga]|uniref:TAM domain methyltransferase n=1 Tax=Clonostachys rhizophaga TaxID=160324 RepID=A0A9N9VGS2_9HYPO|nr:unnamed protein product [Clonostachys rhizophaga]
MVQNEDADYVYIYTLTSIETEADQNEVDSTYGDDIPRLSVSFCTSAFEYEYEYGRRYHSFHAGAYKFPNDEIEQARLNISIELGDYCPSATIIGNDLSPIQPRMLPPNVRFLVGDVEAEWIEPEPYDYIHCRSMAGSIKDWAKLFKQIFDNLKPGGWVEFQETANTVYSEDNTLGPDNALVQLMNGLTKACDEIGRTLNPTPSFQKWAQEVGFTSIKEQQFKLPVGEWPKEERLKRIGLLFGTSLHIGVEGFTAKMFRETLGWSGAEVEILNAKVRTASVCVDEQAISRYIVVTAQKPS